MGVFIMGSSQLGKKEYDEMSNKLKLIGYLEEDIKTSYEVYESMQESQNIGDSKKYQYVIYDILEAAKGNELVVVDGTEISGAVERIAGLAKQTILYPGEINARIYQMVNNGELMRKADDIKNDRALVFGSQGIKMI